MSNFIANMICRLEKIFNPQTLKQTLDTCCGYEHDSPVDWAGAQIVWEMSKKQLPVECVPETTIKLSRRGNS